MSESQNEFRGIRRFLWLAVGFVRKRPTKAVLTSVVICVHKGFRWTLRARD